MTMALLLAENLTRTLPGEIPVTLVNNASLYINAGEFMAITGPSGSGKSSLLYLLGLLDRPTTGHIHINGQDTGTMDENALAALRLESLGFIFQSHFLLPEFSALENVMLPMRRLRRLSMQAAKDRGMGLLADFGLADHAHKTPRQLSGGQSQRVAVARALANEPVLILADEPTGNLDTASSTIVQNILKDLAHSRKRAVIAVTHDPRFAAMADRHIRIVDGRIADTSMPENSVVPPPP